MHVLSVTIDVEGNVSQTISRIEHAQGNMYELPTCPVCLERMDSAVTGLITVPCSHTFHCACLSKWGDSRCVSTTGSELNRIPQILLQVSSLSLLSDAIILSSDLFNIYKDDSVCRSFGSNPVIMHNLHVDNESMDMLDLRKCRMRPLWSSTCAGPLSSNDASVCIGA